MESGSEPRPVQVLEAYTPGTEWYGNYRNCRHCVCVCVETCERASERTSERVREEGEEDFKRDEPEGRNLVQTLHRVEFGSNTMKQRDGDSIMNHHPLTPSSRDKHNLPSVLFFCSANTSYT
jgi:hypothetical protein